MKKNKNKKVKAEPRRGTARGYFKTKGKTYEYVEGRKGPTKATKKNNTVKAVGKAMEIKATREVNMKDGKTVPLTEFKANKGAYKSELFTDKLNTPQTSKIKPRKNTKLKTSKVAPAKTITKYGVSKKKK